MTRALDQSAHEKSFSYCKIIIVVYRILSTYIIWRAIKDQVPLLSRPFRAVHDEFRKRLLGSKSNKTREATCFSYTNNVLGPMLGAVFIRNAFSPESKQKVYIYLFFGRRSPPPSPSYLAPGKTLSKASIIFQYGNFHSVKKVFNSCLHILTFNICFQVEVMMEGIIQAFLDRVSGVGWIDNQTVEAVREKVRITHFEKTVS